MVWLGCCWRICDFGADFHLETNRGSYVFAIEVCFYTTLILYVLTLLTVSYVGVYLTYVAIPVIVVSGLLMKLLGKRKSKSGEVSNVVARVLNDTNVGLERFNEGMHWFNEKNRIINEKTKPLNEQIHAIRMKMIEPEVKLKYESDPEKEKHLML